MDLATLEDLARAECLTTNLDDNLTQLIHDERP